MGRSKKIVASVLLLMLITISVISLSGCTKKISEEEAKAKVGELVLASYDINVVVYGEGLPTIEIEEEKNSLYATVVENEKFNSTEDIRNEIQRLYSKSFSSVMEATALEGVHGEISGTIVYARYIDGRYGLSMLKDDIALKGEVDVDGEKEEIEHEHMTVLKYNPNTIEIKKISKRFVEAYITSEDGGTTILVTLILEDGEWKLDSPTY